MVTSRSNEGDPIRARSRGSRSDSLAIRFASRTLTGCVQKGSGIGAIADESRRRRSRYRRVDTTDDIRLSTALRKSVHFMHPTNRGCAHLTIRKDGAFHAPYLRSIDRFNTAEDLPGGEPREDQRTGGGVGGGADERGVVVAEREAVAARQNAKGAQGFERGGKTG